MPTITISISLDVSRVSLGARWSMAEKEETTSTRSFGGGEALRGLKKAMSRILGHREDTIRIALERMTSIQACKDAALTGEEDVRLLAVCRLGDFGLEATDALEMALDDDSGSVRVAAVGVLASVGTKNAIPTLKGYLGDNDERVREALNYSVGWLQAHGEEGPETMPERAPVVDDAVILRMEPTPLRTNDDVTVMSGVSISDSELEFRVTVNNVSEDLAADLTITVLTYPADSLRLVEDNTQTVEALKPGGREVRTFRFEITSEAIEGEIITSVTFFDRNYDKVAAKAGNCFVRSLYNQIQPLEMSLDEFSEMKRGKAYWNREHVVEANPKSLFKLVKETLTRKNLHLLRAESSKQDEMSMGVAVGTGLGKFSASRISVTVTIVGHAKGDLSKLRIDVLSEDSELLQVAASELFESLQIAIETMK